MRKYLKLIIVVLLSNILLLNLSSAVYGEGGYRIIIDDEEDLLTPEEEKMLEKKMAEVAEYGNVAFVTVSQYEDTGSYAKKLYRSYFGKESGMLFVIDMGRRNIWIYCDGAIYRTIDRAYANTITDNIYRYAKRGEYYDCAMNAFDQATILLKGGRIAQPMKYISNMLIACVCALLVNFFLLTLQRGDDEKIIAKAVPALATTVGVYVVSKKITSSRSRKHVEYSGGSSSGGGSSGGGGSGGGGGSSGGGGGHSF